MRLLSLNVASVESSWAERTPEIAAWLRHTSPDVIAFQEVSSFGDLRSSVDEILAHSGVKQYFRHLATHPNRHGPGLFGTAVLSRVRPDDAGQIDLPTAPDAIADPTSAWMRLGSVTVYSVHLAADPHNSPYRLKQIEVLKEVIVEANSPVTILAGDFNCEPNSVEMQYLLDPAKGASSWPIDVWATRHSGAAGHTWDHLTNPQAHARSGVRRRLDYVLIDDHALDDATISIVCNRRLIGASYASDHFGLLADIPMI